MSDGLNVTVSADAVRKILDDALRDAINRALADDRWLAANEPMRKAIRGAIDAGAEALKLALASALTPPAAEELRKAWQEGVLLGVRDAGAKHGRKATPGLFTAGGAA